MFDVPYIGVLLNFKIRTPTDDADMLEAEAKASPSPSPSPSKTMRAAKPEEWGSGTKAEER